MSQSVESTQPNGNTVVVDRQNSIREDAETGDADGVQRDDEIRSALGVGRRRSRWPSLIVGLGLGISGALVTTRLLSDDDPATGAATGETVAVGTAMVVTDDLVDSVDYEADLGRGPAQVLLASRDGTVTDALDVGDAVGRGDVVAVIDDRPVVAVYGTEPFWRDLESGDEGADVLQLEANLAAMGFDADATMAVDGDFTSATADAVEEWEESLGLEATGELPLGTMVVVDGPSVVSATSALGEQARAGQELALVEPDAIVADLVVDGNGLDDGLTLTDPVSLGTQIEQGLVLASLDDVAVQAVTEVSIETDLILEAIRSGDIERLENLLVFLGFDPDGAIVVDDEAELATAAAIISWQESVGLEPTGATEAAYYVNATAGSRISDVHVAAETELEAGTLFATTSSPTLAVSAHVFVDEIDNFDVGLPVIVVLADDTELTGRVVSIAEVANEALTVEDLPTVDVEIELDESTDDVVIGPVTIRVETGRIVDAVLVPTRALVSLQEGGFAVSVRQTDGSDRLVGVELGAFDDGLVEIVSGDVSPGDEVVVPA